MKRLKKLPKNTISHPRRTVSLATLLLQPQHSSLQWQWDPFHVCFRIKLSTHKHNHTNMFKIIHSCNEIIPFYTN